MAYTIKQVKAVLSSHGMPVENLDAAAEELCGRHKADLDSLKEERDNFKRAAADADAYKEQLDEANSKLKAESDKSKALEKERDEIKGKYDTATADLEKLKTDNAERETTERSKKSLSDYLKEQKYSEHAIRFIRNKGDFHKAIEFDDDGKATNLADVLKSIQADEDFSGFTPKVTETSHTPATPPANTGGKKAMTKDEIMKIEDTSARQKAIAENHDLFGF